MENFNRFSFIRAAHLINRQLNMNMLPWLIGIAAAAGALLSINVFGILTSGGSFSLVGFSRLGYIVIFIGGYIFTSRIFNELQSPAKSHFYLTLPARVEEKLLSSWIISSVMFTIVSLIALTILSIIISSIIVFFFDGNWKIFNPTDLSNIKMSGVYMVTQTIFLLGSVYFKKNNFLKTLLAIFVVYFSISILMVVFAASLFSQFSQVTFAGNANIEFESLSSFNAMFNNIATIVFWYIIGPFFLFVSYLRLKERQV